MKDYMKIKGDYYEEAHGKNAPKAQSFFYNTREEYFIEFMNLSGSEKIIDIGCGSGTFTMELAKKYPKTKIIGIDISQAVIGFAKKKAKKEGIKNVDFLVSPINKLPKQASNSDVAIVSHLIEHIKKPKEALMEVKKMLKKGGRLFLTTPNYLSLWPLAEIVFDKTMAKKGYSLEEQHISKFDYFSIKKITKEAGFSVSKEKAVYMFSLPAGLLSKKAAEFFFAVDKAIDSLPFGMIIYLEAKKE